MTSIGFMNLTYGMMLTHCREVLEKSRIMNDQNGSMCCNKLTNTCRQELHEPTETRGTELVC